MAPWQHQIRQYRTTLMVPLVVAVNMHEIGLPIRTLTMLLYHIGRKTELDPINSGPRLTKYGPTTRATLRHATEWKRILNDHG